MPADFLGQTAVVTGASSGIGRAVAISLARRGADLVLHARANQPGLQATADQVTAAGRKVQTVLADLADLAACESLVEAAWGDRGVDAWIHCAGADVLTGETASEPFASKLDLLWRVDVRGTVAACRAVGQRMKRKGRGVILTVGWDQALLGMEGDSGEMFAATKGAIMAFTKSLAKSLAPEVRVNCLAPGWIKTEWGDNAPAYWRDRAQREALVGRWGEPTDVAAAAAFLASPQASFITGQVVNINGGFAGHLPPQAATGEGESSS